MLMTSLYHHHRIIKPAHGLFTLKSCILIHDCWGKFKGFSYYLLTLTCHTKAVGLFSKQKWWKIVLGTIRMWTGVSKKDAKDNKWGLYDFWRQMLSARDRNVSNFITKTLGQSWREWQCSIHGSMVLLNRIFSMNCLIFSSNHWKIY